MLLVLLKEYMAMHGPLNFKLVLLYMFLNILHLFALSNFNKLKKTL